MTTFSYQTEHGHQYHRIPGCKLVDDATLIEMQAGWQSYLDRRKPKTLAQTVLDAAEQMFSAGSVIVDGLDTGLNELADRWREDVGKAG